MIQHETFEALVASHAVTPVREALNEAMRGDGLVVTPKTMALNDLEQFMPERRRMRGVFLTKSLTDFAAYVGKHKEQGAAVFVDSDSMAAKAILNLGATEEPGHCDNKAVYSATQTAAYAALLRMANGQPRSQRDIAEFIEDWSTSIDCSDDDGAISIGQAVAAIRNVTVEALRKVEASEAKLSASQSTFENVQAKSKERIPTTIEFCCEPYQGLEDRTFGIRLGILTTDKPAIVLRIVKLEEHQELMASELAELAETAVNQENSDVPVYVGSFDAR